MKVYVVLNARNGAFVSVWSTAVMAVEARDSLERLLGESYTIVTYKIDRVNEWETYYD